MKRSKLAPLLMTAALTGCTTFGGNVKGSFDCKAPAGTCAPMGSIDAQAVTGLGAATTTSLDGVATDGARAYYAGIGDAAPIRTNDRVLKIVFPAHTDGTGIYRDEAVARVVVEHGGWIPGPETIAARAPRGELSAASEADAEGSLLKTGSKVGDALARASGTPAARAADPASAPAGLREVAATLEAAPMPQLEPGAIASVSADVAVGSNGAPSPQAIAAARAGHRIGGGKLRTASVRRDGSRQPSDGGGARELNQAQLGAVQKMTRGQPTTQPIARVAFRPPSPGGTSAGVGAASSPPLGDPFASDNAGSRAAEEQPQ